MQGQMASTTPATEWNYLGNYGSFPYFLFKYTNNFSLVSLDFFCVFCGVLFLFLNLFFFHFSKTGYQFLKRT